MPTPGRLRAVTILIVLSALLFAGSMALPLEYDSDRYQPGWTLAWLAAFGAAHAYPVCVLGLLANLLFVAGGIVVLVRRAGFAQRAGGLGGVSVSAIGLG